MLLLPLLPVPGVFEAAVVCSRPSAQHEQPSQYGLLQPVA